jgi:hypothetical protein
VLEAGTWSKLSVAYRDLVAPTATPSGLTNRYRSISFRFPIAVKVAGLSTLLDVLVCRRR